MIEEAERTKTEIKVSGYIYIYIYMLQKILNLKREEGIAIKSKETSCYSVINN